MKVDIYFQDKRYLLVDFRQNSLDYILLYDANHHSLVFAQKENKIDLGTFWQQYQKDKNYCLPCELMLYFKKKLALAPDYAPLERGISLKTAQEALGKLNKIIDLPKELKKFKIKG
jgi:hypothetical protein